MTDMNKQTEALKLALEALKMCRGLIRNNIENLVPIASPNPWFSQDVDHAISAIREALASEANEQPAQPRAWFTVDELNAWAEKKLKENPQWADQPAQRCPLCNYQHGHAIGCKNNPVDIALNKMAENARELGLDYEQPAQQEPVGMTLDASAPLVMVPHQAFQQPAQQEPEYWLWACGQHIQVSLKKPEHGIKGDA